MGFGASTGVVGSGVDHASFEPQASEFESPAKLLELLFWVVDAGLEGAWIVGAGVERLNGELKVDVGAGAGAFCGAGAGGGSAMSKRSFEIVAVAGFEGTVDESDAKLKSPKSFESSDERFAWGFCRALDVMAGFDASFGPASKKPPPLTGGDVI